MRNEEIRMLQNEATAEKKVTFTQDYNKRRAPSHGSGIGPVGEVVMRL